MNEALNSLYNDLKNSGFKGTPEQFKTLMMTDSEARSQVYNDLKSSGFVGTQDQFHELIGFGQQPAPQVKKKADMVSPSANTSSGSPLAKPTNAFQERLQADRLGREVSMRPVETAAPKQALSVGGAVTPETPEQIIEKTKPQPTPQTQAQDIYLNKSMDLISQDLIDQEEEFVVPKLKYYFEDYGFKFDESGVGDKVKVSAPNGNTIEIPLDNFTSAGDNKAANELKQFIVNNKQYSSSIQSKEALLSAQKDKFYSDVEMQDAIKSMDSTAKSLHDESVAFLSKKKSLEDKINYFQSLSPEQKVANSDMYNQIQSETKLLTATEKSIIDRENALAAEKVKLNQRVGKYTSYKAEQGDWQGALYNSVLEGFASIPSGLNNIRKSINDMSVKVIETIVDATLPEGEANVVRQAIKNNPFIFESTHATSADKKLREAVSGAIADKGTTKEFVAKKAEDSFVGGAVIGLAQSAPAMILGPAAAPAMIAQAADGVYQELENSPYGKDMSMAEKGAYAITIGAVVGALEKVGFSNAIAEKGLLNGIVAKVMGKVGANVAGKSFAEFVDQEVNSLVAKGLLRVGAAGLAEAETGGLQELFQSSAEMGINAIKDAKVFNAPENVEDFIKGVLVSAGQEALGGHIMGTIPATIKAYQENNFDKLLNNQIEILDNISKDGNYRSAFMADLKDKVSRGEMSVDDAKKQENSFNEVMSLSRSIPDDLSSEDKKKALKLLKEKKDLSNKIKDKDEELVKKEKSRIDEINSLLNQLGENKNAVQESSTEESVLRTEQPEMGLQEVGEGNTQVEATPQEVVTQEEVTPAEPLEQRSNKLLDAISKARELGAEGVGVLNELVSKLRSIADERINQIGNKIDDLKQKSRDLISSGTIQASKLSDLVGSKVNYNGQEGTLNISEGGAVTIETPNQVIDIENATPDSLAADFKISTPKPSVSINPESDKYIDNNNVTIDNVDYGINTDDNGNVVGLVVSDGSGQVLSNPELLKKAEIIRNTEGKVSNQIETTLNADTQSKVDELNNQISALESERSAIQKEISGPEETQSTPAEKRFAGNVLASTRIVAEDLAKLVSILTKANKNINVIVDKQKMIDFLVKKGLSPEQASQVKGFRIGDKVFINPDLATVDTPIHEFAHVWGELCKKQRPELWKRGMSLITKSNYYKDLVARIKADPSLANLYSSPNAIKEEALIQAIGERGAVIFDDNKLQLMWNNWVKTFDAFIKKVLGLPMETDITKIKLSEFLDMAATEVLTGKSTGVGGEMTIEKTKAAKNIELAVQPQMSANDLAKIVNDAIKAKLSKAQIVDILVKRGGLTDAEANQAYNDVKSTGSISITTTGTTPAATTTTVKPGAKYIAAISDAIENLAGGNLSPEVKDSIIKSIKDARTAIKNTLAAERAIRKEVASAVNNLVSKGDLTQKQAAAIIKRFASVDMFNDAAIDKFITNTFGVFEKATAKQEQKGINTLAKRAKKNIQTKVGAAINLVNSLNRIFNVKAAIIPKSVYNDYVSLVNQFSSGSAVLSLDQKPVVEDMVQRITDAMDAELLGVSILKDEFDNYADKVLDDTGKVEYQKTLDKMLADGTISLADKELMTKYKKEVFPAEKKAPMTDAEIEQEKRQLLNDINAMQLDTETLPSNDENDMSLKLKELLRTNGVKNLSNGMLRNTIKLIQLINNGYLPHYAVKVIKAIDEQNKAAIVEKATRDAKPLKFGELYSRLKGLITRKNGIYEMGRRELLNYMDQAFGNFKEKPFFNSLFKEVAKAEALFKSVYSEITNTIDNAETKVFKSLGYDINNTLMSKYKMMAYMLQKEFESNPGRKDVHPAIEFLDATIAHLKKDPSKTKEVEMLEKIKTEFTTDGEIDNDKLMASFNDAEKDALKTLREINDSLTEKAIFTDIVIRGKKIKPLNDYIHRSVLPQNNQTDFEASQAQSQSFMSSLNPSTRGGALEERTSAVSPINFDVFSSVAKSSKQTLLDYHMTLPIQTSYGTLKLASDNLAKNGNLSMKDTEVMAAVENMFDEAVRNVIENNFTEGGFVDDVIKFMNKQGYRVILASVPRSVSELIGNMAYAVWHPVEFADGLKDKAFLMSKDAIDFMRNAKSVQTTRVYSNGGQSGRFIDDSVISATSGLKRGGAKGVVGNFTSKINNKFLKKHTNLVGAAADFLISTPDKVLIRPLWFGTFKSEFKKLTGEDVDKQKVAKNDREYMLRYKDAIEKATDAADKMTVFAGGSDNPFLGMLKGKSRPNQSAAKKIFNTYNNFMTNFLMYEYATARTGIRAMIGQGDITKKQGAAMVAAVTSRMVAYQIASKLLINGMVGLFSDDEDEEDKSVDKKIEQGVASALTTMVLNRNFGNMTKSFINLGTEKLNENYLTFLREGEYDPKRDNIQYSFIGNEIQSKQPDAYRLLTNFAGPYSPMARTAGRIYRQTWKQLSGNNAKEEAAVMNQNQERNITIPMELAGQAGIIPLYTDVARIVNAQLSANVKKAEKAAQGGGGGGLTQDEMKRYMPEMYEKIYGKGTPAAEAKEIKAEVNKKQRDTRKKILDKMFGTR